ncbi:MAG: NAD-dependent deacylase [Saprospiraceae bacterium]
MKKKIVVLSGAGMSAESGIKTFRDADGLWENHDIMEVATPEGWRRNMELVLEFYNQRRRQLFEVQPNAGHKALVELEAYFEVNIVTQNVDDLHERAGSTNVLHLHGELTKARSTLDERLVYEWKKDILPGDKCEKGSQLRPHIVWFGEEVPMLNAAMDLMDETDIAIIVGTSMQVYPAAGLIGYANPDTTIFYIDPKPAINFELRLAKNLEVLAENASTGVRKVVDILSGK